MDADSSPASRPDRNEFVVANQEKLRAYAARKLVNMRVPSGRLQPEDVVNHTVAELLDRWDAIEEPQRYMYAVARNFIQDAARKGGRFTGAPADADADGQPEAGRLSEIAPGWTSQPEQEVINRLLLAQLQAGATASQREAVSLVDGAGATRQEAAQDMGVAVGTVSSHRARGLRWMRQNAASLGLIAALVLAGGGLTAGMTWVFMRLLGPGNGDTLGLPDWAIPAAVSLALLAERMFTGGTFGQSHFMAPTPRIVLWYLARRRPSGEPDARQTPATATPPVPPPPVSAPGMSDAPPSGDVEKGPNPSS